MGEPALNIKTKVVALVPMKGHSERVPRKNLKELNGISLYHWIVKSLLAAEYIDEVIVETDSDEIERDVKKHFGLNVLRRPDDLIGDEVPMNDLIKFHLSMVNSDIYLQTHATNPLLESKTIDATIKRFIEIKDKYDSLFSVTRIQARLYDDKGIPVNHDPQELLPTQQLPKLYEENSNIYIFTKESFQQKGRRIGEKPYMHEINKLEAVDIDDMEDFILAEAMLKSLDKNNE